VNQFPACLTINPTALGGKVHEAEEKDGDAKREEGGDVGVHGLSCDEVSLLTQNAAYSCGTTQSSILNKEMGLAGFEPVTKRLLEVAFRVQCVFYIIVPVTHHQLVARQPIVQGDVRNSGFVFVLPEDYPIARTEHTCRVKALPRMKLASSAPSLLLLRNRNCAFEGRKTPIVSTPSQSPASGSKVRIKQPLYDRSVWLCSLSFG